MIYKIANLLKDEIETLNFVDIAVGLAKPVTVKINTTTEEDVSVLPKIVPMAINDLDDPCEPGDLIALVPDTTKAIRSGRRANKRRYILLSFADYFKASKLVEPSFNQLKLYRRFFAGS